jgi:hypothetical protein
MPGCTALHAGLRTGGKSYCDAHVPPDFYPRAARDVAVLQAAISAAPAPRGEGDLFGMAPAAAGRRR